MEADSKISNKVERNTMVNLVTRVAGLHSKHGDIDKLRSLNRRHPFYKLLD